MLTDWIIIGVGGHVVALDVASGDEIWRTKLKGSDVVTVCTACNRVFAGTKGELFCLDQTTGAVLWHNTLKGLKTGVVAFASSDDEIVAAFKAQEAAAAAAAG